MNTTILNTTLKMTPNVWEAIRNTIGSAPAETGGIGFGSRENMIVTKFIVDPRQGTRGTYTLNAKYFNAVIEKLWREEGLEPIMINHSHPFGNRQPSAPDIEIGKKYLNRFDLDMLLFPIIESRADYEQFQLLPYAFSKINEGKTFVKLSSIEIIPEGWNDASECVTINSLNEIKEEQNKLLKQEFASTPTTIDFNRIEQAVSVSKMKSSHLLIVGTGGAASFCKQIARIGIGKLTLIDPDLCANENMPRQAFQFEDALNQVPKVLALRNEISKINPAVEVTAIQADFTQIDEGMIDSLVKNVDIMLMLTDSFKCQAFGNTIALKYQKMAVWAGFYTMSRAAELFFYIPGITEACFRCAVSSRYEAQAKRNIKIPSSANTIFHSDLLDSHIGFIVLALLHNDIPGYEFSEWFPKGFRHNLIQFKTSPFYDGIFKELYGSKTEFFNFGAVWQEVKQETTSNGYAYNCCDCASGKVSDKTPQHRGGLKHKILKFFSFLKKLFIK